MAALDVRLVGLELQANVTAVKTVVDALKVAVDAIDTETSTWVCNGADNLLPDEADVKTQLLAYEALSVAVSKPGNSIGDSISVIKASL
jgi:hypothetical protein